MEKFTVESLREFLNLHGVDTSSWGTGIFKSIETLVGDVNDGEIEIIIGKNGKAEAVLETCSADIYYKKENGEIWKIRETKQVMKNGEIKELTHKESIRGKCKKLERPEDAIKREIEEEIGVPPSGYGNLQFLEVRNFSGMSTSFPGLLGHYTQHCFETYLKKEYFKPEGYIEKQPDKTVYFEWEKIL